MARAMSAEIFGIVAPGNEVSRLTYFALYALQHRGQESAGIATSQNGHIMAMRDQGLVNQVFDEQKLRALQGDMAVGHVRYSTTGANSWENTQPVYRADKREVALGHNGNLVNVVELHQELRDQGVTFRSTSDSEIIAALLSTHEAPTIEEALVDVISRLEGAYSTVVMTEDRVVAFRDPMGLRPLSLGMLGDALLRRERDLRLRHHRREVPARRPAGRDRLDHQEGHSDAPGRASRRAARCASSSTSTSPARTPASAGQVIQVSRGPDGRDPRPEAPVDADLVIPVPDSGNPAARGYARASGLPQDDGLIKNRYVARTFIQPGQELRKHGLRLKFNPLPEVVAGKRIVVVDDSIVRGNTTRQIVQMLRDAGAQEVHMRISAPPIRHPCHYGIDMSTREEMIAHNRTAAEVAAELGADSLAYLSLEGVYEAINGSRETHCDACFSGEYPLIGTSDEGRIRERPPARSQLTAASRVTGLSADRWSTCPILNRSSRVARGVAAVRRLWLL